MYLFRDVFIQRCIYYHTLQPHWQGKDWRVLSPELNEAPPDLFPLPLNKYGWTVQHTNWHGCGSSQLAEMVVPLSSPQYVPKNSNVC